MKCCGLCYAHMRVCDFLIHSMSTLGIESVKAGDSMRLDFLTLLIKVILLP